MAMPAEEVFEHCARHAARLHILRNRPGLPLRSDALEILTILNRLATMPVTKSVLRQTGIGLEINNKFLRDHSSKDVRSQSCELIRKWKELAGVSQPTENLNTAMGPSETDCNNELVSADLPGTPVIPTPVSPSVVESPEKSANMSPAEFLARCRSVSAAAPNTAKSKHGKRSHGEVLLKKVVKREDPSSRQLAKVLKSMGVK